MFQWWHDFLYDSDTFVGTIVTAGFIAVIVAFVYFAIMSYKDIK